MKACEKRSVSANILEDITARVEEHISERYDREVPSRVIGNIIMRELRKVDQVAYVRFASVYRDFKDVEDFEQVAGELRRKKPGKAATKATTGKKPAKKKAAKRKRRSDGDSSAS